MRYPNTTNLTFPRQNGKAAEKWKKKLAAQSIAAPTQSGQVVARATADVSAAGEVRATTLIVSNHTDLSLLTGVFTLEATLKNSKKPICHQSSLLLVGLCTIVPVIATRRVGSSMLLCSISLWMEAILRDTFPLLCNPQLTAVLRSKPPAVGHFNREGISAPIVDWYTRNHETGNRN